TAEMIRQWSTDHPEFAYLPRKFKVAVTGSETDRAVILAHDIGLRLIRDDAGAPGYQVIVGGGLGRTPMVGKVLRAFLPKDQLLDYLAAVLQVYNLSGRRDNKYKARIKILVHETGIEALRAQVEAAFARNANILPAVDSGVVARIQAAFAPPRWADKTISSAPQDAAYRSWCDTNLAQHKRPDHAIVTVSTKAIGQTPGDMSADQMRVLADLAERYGYDELRISHEQNVILPHVHQADLPALHHALKEAGLATANIGLVSDIIACPGMDYCALATARSIPVAQQISEAFADLDAQHDIGPLKIKISGCINACGHHHVGHIGILGLDKAGVESYQLTLGGDGTETMVIGDRTGPGFAYDEVVPAVERLIAAYLDLREDPSETFLAAYRRLGLEPFKIALYGTPARKAA
ncbi:MAG: nitrite/sulfite reductase, partial [Pseudomonadota bacterium]